ncbi:septal ring lytic transglycosylase RlpA family lipoprotein [Paremcibacter congregatus]|uniref:Endolytic peptidoglycan transglycosylase RlpA n=1 Tax=Paremcibacter congregatus TaxID=2043170 RepID=A0A2G4YVA7_9PROT|nr:septal ring lytic transglycosylase RlpA family lipoprotein [Paremcibacter congregatus]QDE27251.1 septal ring lytic transglycosylase RlpA family protein [Paremcibacter congregatus]
MNFLKTIFILSGCLVLVACGNNSGTYEAGIPPVPNPAYKVGKPYKVAGKTYRPVVDPQYDRTGLASWYGSQFHGRKTANGDVFNMNDLTAAHTTLPMPSYVKVTNLDNGRFLVLKVNDRGPFVGDRLIDVSRRAAQLLGFEKKGVTKVRVQAVDGPQGRLPQQRMANNAPSVKKKAPLLVARPTIDVVEETLTAPGNASSVQEARAKKLYVQIGAYSDPRNANKVAKDIDHVKAAKVEKVDVNGQNLYRVRIGPHPTLEFAEIILGRVLSLGHNTARIISDY